MRKISKALTGQEKATIETELKQAYDFDPKDPLFGLTRQQLGGPELQRRSVLRLLAAAGTLTAWHLMPGSGIKTAQAASGGHLKAGWAGVGAVWASAAAKGIVTPAAAASAVPESSSFRRLTLAPDVDPCGCLPSMSTVSGVLSIGSMGWFLLFDRSRGG